MMNMQMTEEIFDFAPFVPLVSYALYLISWKQFLCSTDFSFYDLVESFRK